MSGTAGFTIASAAGSQPVTYSEASGNLIFCRPGGARFQIRLARDRGGDGAGGPHVDIDVCNFTGSGTFGPTDPRLPCPAGPAWDIFWHDEAGAVFVNDGASPACRLDLVRAGNMLDGVFTCDGLRELNGARTLGVHAGTFRCASSG